MTQESSSSQRLTFCDDCGCMRLRDVTSQLQELFTKRTIVQDVCGICNRSTTPDNIQTSDTSDSAELTTKADKGHEDNTIENVTDDGDSHNIVTFKPGSWLHSYASEPATGWTLEEDGRNVSLEGQAQGTAAESQLGDEGMSKTVGDSSSSEVSKSTQILIDILASQSEVAAATKEEITDAEQNLQQSERATRLSTGALKTKNYQSLSEESKIDGVNEDEERGKDEELLMDVDDDDDEDFVPEDSEDEAIHLEASASQGKNENSGGAMAGDVSKNVRKAVRDGGDSQSESPNIITSSSTRKKIKDGSIDLSQYEVVHSVKISGPGGRRPNGEEKNNTLAVLDPALQKLVMEGSNPKKRFKCTLCSGAFKFVGRFHKHLTNCHSDDIQVPQIKRPFCCLYCNAKFAKMRGLSAHSYQHELKNIITYKCCDFYFNRRENLIRHIEVHKGIRKYQCQECGIGFEKNSLYSKHMSKVHGLKNPEMQGAHGPSPAHGGKQGIDTKPSKKRTTGTKKSKMDNVTILDTQSGSKKQVATRSQKELKEGTSCHKRIPKYKMKCDHCPLIFKKMHNMKKHQMSKHWKTVFPCARCKLSFKMKSSLTLHIQGNRCGQWFAKPEEYLNDAVLDMMGPSAHDDMPFRCKHCTDLVEFKKPVEFLEHQKENHGDIYPEIEKIMKVAFKCSECNHMLPSPELLVAHLTDHDGDGSSFRCSHPHCDKTFDSKQDLTTHNLTHPLQCSYLCCFCQKSTDTKESIFKHLKEAHSHQMKLGMHYCPFCGESFSNKKLSIKHLKIQHGIRKPYRCTLCTKSYADKTTLDEHMLSHLGRKEHLCSLCGLRFTTKKQLQCHIKVVHQERVKSEPRFICPECGKRFMSNNSQIIHVQRVHRKLKPFVCETCGQAFGGKSDLTKHMVVHSGVKPYKCDQCSYECVRVDYLRKHQRTHGPKDVHAHGARNVPQGNVRTDAAPQNVHRCNQCGQFFANDNTLLDHIRTHHAATETYPVQIYTCM